MTGRCEEQSASDDLAAGVCRATSTFGLGPRYQKEEQAPRTVPGGLWQEWCIVLTGRNRV
jgi:hypothetical protein